MYCGADSSGDTRQTQTEKGDNCKKGGSRPLRCRLQGIIQVLRIRHACAMDIRQRMCERIRGGDERDPQDGYPNPLTKSSHASHVPRSEEIFGGEEDLLPLWGVDVREKRFGPLSPNGRGTVNFNAGLIIGLKNFVRNA